MTPKYTAAVSALLLLLVGCGAGRVNLASLVTAEAIPTHKASVANLNVYREGAELVVSGKVMPTVDYDSHDEGHVDVMVFGPDWKLLHRVSVLYAPRDLRQLRRWRQDSSFVARFSAVPPAGSVARASFHDGCFVPGPNGFDCGKNAAPRPL